MKRKLAIALMIFLCALSGNMIAHAALEIQSVMVDFSRKSATIKINEGNFVVSNFIQANGDTVQTNSFISAGSDSTTLSGALFSSVFGGLMQQGAVNMDAVTNATMEITGASIAGTDTTVTDIPANNQINSI